MYYARDAVPSDGMEKSIADAGKVQGSARNGVGFKCPGDLLELGNSPEGAKQNAGERHNADGLHLNLVITPKAIHPFNPVFC